MIHDVALTSPEILALLTGQRSSLALPPRFHVESGDRIHISPCGQPDRYVVFEATAVLPGAPLVLVELRRPPISPRVLLGRATDAP